jgi:tRNA(Ile)-lysidine synthase
MTPGRRSASGPGALPAGVGRDVLIEAVRAALAVVLPVGARVGVAVSGGPDSAGLALLVRAARPDLDLVAVHVRHGLRDDAPDAAAAQALAAHLGIPCEVRAVAVGGEGGPEAAARSARYAALREVARALDLVAVLLGHTAEDQAETVLLHLVRGAGLGGLAGMRPTRTVDGLLLLRPLLRLRRADVREVPVAEGVAVVEDPTNDDPEQRRARARLDVLPALAGLTGGPGDPVGALTRLAALAADDDAHLEAEASAHAERLVAALGEVRMLPAGELDALPVALARRVVRRCLVEVRGGAEDLAAGDVEAALAADAERIVGGAVAVERSRGWLLLRPAALRGLPARPLEGHGGTALPEIAANLVVEAGAPPDAPGSAEGPGAAAAPAAPDGPGPAATPPPWLPRAQVLALGAPPMGWTVRGAAPGDELVLGGRSRPVRELLRAAGVPRGLRPLLPVLVDADGAVRWLPGIATADPSDAADGDPHVVRLLGAGGARPLGYPAR